MEVRTGRGVGWNRDPKKLGMTGNRRQSAGEGFRVGQRSGAVLERRPWVASPRTGGDPGDQDISVWLPCELLFARGLPGPGWFRVTSVPSTLHPSGLPTPSEPEPCPSQTSRTFSDMVLTPVLTQCSLLQQLTPLGSLSATSDPSRPSGPASIVRGGGGVQWTTGESRAVNYR